MAYVLCMVCKGSDSECVKCGGTGLIQLGTAQRLERQMAAAVAKIPAAK